MTLIKSISGIRGTLGGKPGESLSPIDVVRFSAAFGKFIQNRAQRKSAKIVVGRDARPSGSMVSRLAIETLIGMGIDVFDCGLSTTPTVEMMVPHLQADGGMIFTASHNPVNWNALKLLNEKGEFINAAEGAQLLDLVSGDDYEFAPVENLGAYHEVTDAISIHIQKILELPLVDPAAIEAANFKIAVDAVNSTGGISILPLLEALGVKQVHAMYCEPTGFFPHNPEPLAAHLGDIMKAVSEQGCDLGIVVDPDVDRLALICEDGSMFGEEYTLVAVADYILQHHKGATVSNLSSSRALRMVTEGHGGTYTAAAVGEVNVVQQMKDTGAVIGGEGNGGIIYPDLHYGRDALVGIALLLTHLAKTGKSLKTLREGYPNLFMSKQKANLRPEMDVDAILANVALSVKDGVVNTLDGVKIDFETAWVHLRKSNTEPIVRIYTEAPTQEAADLLANTWAAKLEA
jgi:phosphomannomutase